MAALSSGTLVKTPRRSRSVVMSRKNRSTLFNQEAEVGVKCMTKRGCLASHERVLQAVAGTVVCSPFAKCAADGMLVNDFTPQFPVELVEKDFGYVLASAASPGSAPTLRAAHQVFLQAERQGLGDKHLTAVMKLFAS